MRQNEWAQIVATTVAGEVRRYRKEQRMSAQRLAERCSELGYDVPRAVIANLESGRRTTVTLAEVLVLAAALAVPPMLLMAPVGRSEAMEPIPEAVTEPWAAARWISGDSQLPGVSMEGRPEIWVLLRMFQMHEHEVAVVLREQERADSARRERTGSGLAGEESTLSAFGDMEGISNLGAAEQRVERAREQLTITRTAIRGVDLIPPRLPLELQDLDHGAEQ